MIDTQGYDDDGVPYFYDLYLDLIVYPDGNIVTDDMDELQGALNCRIPLYHKVLKRNKLKINIHS